MSPLPERSGVAKIALLAAGLTLVPSRVISSTELTQVGWVVLPLGGGNAASGEKGTHSWKERGKRGQWRSLGVGAEGRLEESCPPNWEMPEEGPGAGLTSFDCTFPRVSLA